MRNLSQALPLTRSRFIDYLELTKPRVSLLVLFTVAAGGVLANRGAPDLVVLLHTVLGTALVAAGASALNQLLERHTDALMRRTENRPLPAGRLQPVEVWMFGLGLGVIGLAYLAAAVRQPLALAVAGVCFVSYVFVYTPLKRRTTLNTLVGAVPGALPPLIGWTALGGSIDASALVLFLILFLWQVPHFLAIAWIYRDDYARAGLRMLPTVDRHGILTGRQMVLYSMTLIPVSLFPLWHQQAGWIYGFGGLVLGVCFAAASLSFLHRPGTAAARRVLHASLVYLPMLLALLMLDWKP